MRLKYLTEEEAKMPLDMALLQLALGLQTCKSKGDAVRLLQDAVEIGRREERNRTVSILEKGIISKEDEE